MHTHHLLDGIPIDLVALVRIMTETASVKFATTRSPALGLSCIVFAAKYPFLFIIESDCKFLRYVCVSLSSFNFRYLQATGTTQRAPTAHKFLNTLALLNAIQILIRLNLHDSFSQIGLLLALAASRLRGRDGRR